MIRTAALLAAGFFVAAFAPQAFAQEKPKLVKSWDAPNGMKLTLEATKPQDLESDLQVMCYFQHDPKGDVLISVIVDFDKSLGNPIKNLRDRGLFVGELGESLVLTPPAGVMKPKQVLLVGYGPRDKFELSAFSRVGTTAVRNAVKLGARKVAFAPAVKDQGFDKFGVDDVEQENVQGIILAYDTEKRLQKAGLAKEFSIDEFVIEAGPEYFEKTVKGVEKGLELAKAALAKREAASLVDKK